MTYKYETQIRQQIVKINHLEKQFNEQCNTIAYLEEQITENDSIILKLSTASGIESIKKEYRNKVIEYHKERIKLEGATYEMSQKISRIHENSSNIKKYQDEIDRKNEVIRELKKKLANANAAIKLD